MKIAFGLFVSTLILCGGKTERVSQSHLKIK